MHFLFLKDNKKFHKFIKPNGLIHVHYSIYLQCLSNHCIYHFNDEELMINGFDLNVNDFCNGPQISLS